MTERGTVQSVDGARATIECADESCDSCSTLVCNPRTRSLVAAVGAFHLEPGDEVDVSVGEKGVMAKAALLLLAPIVGFIAAYLATGSLADPWRVAIGLAGVALGFCATVLASRLWPDSMPQVTRVYDRSAGSAASVSHDASYPYVSQNEPTT